MAKVVLPNQATGFDVARANNNKDEIVRVLNEKVLWRDNPKGEPNQMHSDMDMNAKRMYNLPEPVLEHEAARKKDLDVSLANSKAVYDSTVQIKDLAVQAKDRAVLAESNAQNSASITNKNVDLSVQILQSVSSGTFKYFKNKAEANAATIAEGAFVQVFVDESEDNSNIVYKKEGGVLVKQVDLDSLRKLLLTPSVGSEFVKHSGTSSVATDSLSAAVNNIAYTVTGHPWYAPTDGSDASAAINSAIAYVSAKGGGTLVAEGTFTLDNPLDLKSGVVLDAKKARFVQGSNKNLEDLIIASGASRFALIGGVIDVAFRNQTYQASRENVGRGILTYNCSEFVIDGVTIEDPYGSGVLCAASNQFVVKGIKASDPNANATTPVKLNSCTKAFVKECVLTGKEMFTGYGIEVLAPSSDIVVDGNDLTFYQVVALNETSFDPTKLARIRIVNNCIKTPSADNSIHWSVDSVFSNNVIQDSGDVGMSHDYSVRLTCTGNVVNGSNASALAAPGAINCTFTGNVLRNPGRQNRRPVTPGQRCGIWLPNSHDGNAPYIYPTGNTVVGNTIVDESGGMYFGISVASAPDSSNRNLVPSDMNYIDGPLPINRLIDYSNKLLPSTQWVSMGLYNGWQAVGSGFAPLAVYKDGNGKVSLRGVISSGTVNSIIAYLPEGYRPQYKMLVNALTSDGAGELVLNTDGSIILQKGGVGFLSLDSCTFRT